MREGLATLTRLIRQRPRAPFWLRLVRARIISLTLGTAKVVVCALALAIGSPAEAQPGFSHQLHLNKVGVTCTVCHNSATTSKAATDRNLPQQETCLACHNGKTAPKVEISWLPEREIDERTYRFDHEFHTKLGNIAPLIAVMIDSGTYLGKHGDIRRHLDSDNECQACHRGLQETELAGKSNLPQMSDCLVCHSEIDNPFSCETCHLEGVNLKPASHTRTFIDQHSTGKLGLDKSSCLPCHGTNFACMGCH